MNKTNGLLTILGASALSSCLIGGAIGYFLGYTKNQALNNTAPISPTQQTGTIVREGRSLSGDIYGFKIQLDNGEKQFYEVHGAGAPSLDELINIGDRISIDFTKGSDYVLESKQVSLVEKSTN